VIDKPEDETKDDAKKNGCGQRKGEAPSAASPVEISGQATDGDIEPVESYEDDADDDEKQAKRDEDAAEVGHDGFPLPGTKIPEKQVMRVVDGCLTGSLHKRCG
jgi:hypothetical protein